MSESSLKEAPSKKEKLSISPMRYKGKNKTGKTALLNQL